MASADVTPPSPVKRGAVAEGKTGATENGYHKQGQTNGVNGNHTNGIHRAKESSSKAKATTARPWYRRGGMHVNMVGMAVNIFGPVFVLAWTGLTEAQIKPFVGLLSFNILVSLCAMKSVYCILVVPTFMTSLLLSLTLPKPAILLAAALAIAITKVNICMSVCLHRYAAHAAFKCGPVTSFCMGILGCLANQGGPIWWASQHRCHHKYCDVKRDPHSPIVDGTEMAFSFFERHEEVEEEFAPLHLETPLNRFMDTWSFATVTTELILSYMMFGNAGLFVAYTSGWICQSITLWFNVANHPPTAKDDCKAANSNFRPTSYYVPYHFFDMLYPLFNLFVSEKQHKHHHDYAGLARRDNCDFAYMFFLLPLEKAGLIWKVNI